MPLKNRIGSFKKRLFQWIILLFSYLKKSKEKFWIAMHIDFSNWKWNLRKFPLWFVLLPKLILEFIGIVIEKFREITQNLLIFTFDKYTRICISNEAGYLLKIHIYKVEEAPDTGILKFFSYTDAEYGFFEHGPMHCLPVSTPYITKVCKIWIFPPKIGILRGKN